MYSFMHQAIIGLLIFAAMGSSPRRVEEIQIGGGYGESRDGGMDVDGAGNLSTNGNAVVDGHLFVRTLGTPETPSLLSLLDDSIHVNGAVSSSGGAVIAGDLLVNGGDIGFSTDPDVLHLSNAHACINGVLEAHPEGDVIHRLSRLNAGSGTYEGANAAMVSHSSMLMTPGFIQSATGKTFLCSGYNQPVVVRPCGNTSAEMRVEPSGNVEVHGNLHLSGSLVPDGGKIGISADDDLVGLGNGQLTIRGILNLEADSLQSSGTTLTLNPQGMGILGVGANFLEVVNSDGKIRLVHGEAGGDFEFEWYGDNAYPHGLGWGQEILRRTDLTDASEDSGYLLRLLHGGAYFNAWEVDDLGTGKLSGDLHVNGGDLKNSIGNSLTLDPSGAGFCSVSNAVCTVENSGGRFDLTNTASGENALHFWGKNSAANTQRMARIDVVGDDTTAGSEDSHLAVSLIVNGSMASDQFTLSGTGAHVAGALSVNGNVTLGDSSSDVIACQGAMKPRQVTYSTGMNADVAGVEGEIVYCSTNHVFYGCTASGSPGSWAALH